MNPPILDPQTSVRLMLTLGHLLWQATAIGLAAGAGLWLLRRSGPQRRYGLLVAALLLMAGCPAVTFPLVRPDAPAEPIDALAGGALTPSPSQGQGRGEGDAGGASPLATNPVPPVERPQFGPSRPEPTARTHDSGPPAVTAPRATRSPSQGQGRSEVESAGAAAGLSADARASAASQAAPAWARFAPYVTAAYLLGVVVMLGRLLFALHGGRRLRRAALPVPHDLLAVVARQAERIGLAVAPAVAFCARVAVPTVVGVLRPMVLLPLGLLTGLSPDQVAAVLTHELAHVRRYDHLVNILQRLIEAALFFHPAVWWVSRRIRVEREYCCDDVAVAVGGAGVSPVRYADSLLRLAEMALTGRVTSVNPELAPPVSSPPESPSPLATLSATGGDDRRDGPRRPSRLADRVLRLLGVQPAEPLRLARSWPIALLLLATLALSIPLACRPTGPAHSPAPPPPNADSNLTPRAKQPDEAHWEKVGVSVAGRPIEVEVKRFDPPIGIEPVALDKTSSATPLDTLVSMQSLIMLGKGQQDFRRYAEHFTDPDRFMRVREQLLVEDWFAAVRRQQADLRVLGLIRYKNHVLVVVWLPAMKPLRGDRYINALNMIQRDGIWCADEDNKLHDPVVRHLHETDYAVVAGPGLATQPATPPATQAEHAGSARAAALVDRLNELIARKATLRPEDKWRFLREGLLQETAAQVAQVGGEARAAVPPLVRLLHDEDVLIEYLVARQIVVALGKIGPPAGAAAPRLKELLNHHDGRGPIANADCYAVETAEALWQITQDGDLVIPFLARFDGIVNDRENAVRALGRIGPPAGPTLVKLLDDADQTRRVEAARALGSIRPTTPEIVAALAAALGRQGRGAWELRYMAADSLGAIGPDAKAALPTLKQTVKRFANLHSARAIWRITGDVRQAVPALVVVVERGQTWPQFGPGADRPPPEMIKPSNWQRIEAAKLLCQIGPAAAESLPALYKIVRDDEDPAMRSAAQDAVARIERPPATQPAGRRGAWMWDADGKARRVSATGMREVVNSGLVEGFEDVVSIACSSNGGYLLRADGTVWAWGANGDGRLGDGTTQDRATPVRVKGLTDVTAIAGKWAHGLALKRDGSVWAWGANNHGQCGDGTTENRIEPIQVKDLADVVAVAAGPGYSAALKKDGTVWAWRRGLGDDRNSLSGLPTRIDGVADVVAIAAGLDQLLALRKDGTVWSAGLDYWRDYSFHRIEGLSDVKAVAAGWWFFLALKNDGTVWTWGDLRTAWRGVDPQTIVGPLKSVRLGDDSHPAIRVGEWDARLPYRVLDWDDVAAIDAECRGIVLRTDGGVWEWGWDCPPRRVNLPAKVLAVSTGWNRSMALLAMDEPATPATQPDAPVASPAPSTPALRLDL